MQGVVSQIRLWTVTLSPVEVVEALDLSANVQKENLLAYWPLHHGGTRILDLGPTQACGNLYGSKWILEGTDRVVA